MMRTSRWILRRKLMRTRKKIDVYKLMDSQKSDEYEMTGAEKKIDAYKLMDSQKTREYEMTGARCVQADGFSENS